MGNIALLDDLTINKIAAGEVIERPASVVKELVENSIDAGATSITVEIKNGGISYIRITDNGKGFEKDDMQIAFERHATSKIRSADDLPKVCSMGFRGEALASIAAISRIELKSKTENSNIGNKIVLEGGKVLEFEEDGCPKGSTITIENLFYNTPVRYKFLKKDFTEAGYIEDAITRIALSYPEIAIKFINAGKIILQTSGNNDIKSVIYNIYGKEIAQNIIDVNYEYEDIKVTGVVGKSEIARSNRSNQLFFINKRYVKDKTLSAASEQAFKGNIPMGKFGFLILNLSMDTEKVDVNVHPAKLEVRFEEESKVFKAVYHAIKQTIIKNETAIENKIDSDEGKSLLEEKDFNNTKIEKSLENGETVKFGLFQKLLNKNKSQETEEEFIEKDENNNLIAQIYQNRNKVKENNNEETQVIDVPKEIHEEELPKIEEEKNIEKTQVITIPQVKNSEETQIVNIKEILDNQENKESEEDINDNFDKKIDLEQPKEEFKEYNKENIQDDEKEEKQVLQEKIKEAESKQEKESKYSNKNFEEIYTSVFGIKPIGEKKLEEEPEKYEFNDNNIVTNENISIFEDKKEFNKVKYRLVGTAFKTCYLLEIGQDLYIIDQKTVKEKIVYEELKKDYDLNKLESKSSLMLLPDIIELSKKQMEIAKENRDMYKKAGFEFDEFGENTIKLTKVLDVCLELETKELFIETLNKINTVSIMDREQIEEKFIKTIASAIAEKSITNLSKQETEELLDRLLNSNTPFVDSNGEQIAIKMTKADIEKKFSRR